MSSTRRNLYTIPSGIPFLPMLVRAMREGKLGIEADFNDPSVLTRTTIYLPTRRASQAFIRILADSFEGRPLLLPRVVPLGDIDDTQTALMAMDGTLHGGEIPPAIDELRRRLVLTRLVSALGKSVNRSILKLDPSVAPLMPGSVADAFHLAGDLATLLDQLQIEGIAYDALRNLDVETHDQLWATTAAFLDIVGKTWPRFLDEQGLIDPATHRNRMLDAQCEHLSAKGDTGPMIAAGSTGTVPATARLLRTIARLPQGAVILPGLDQELEPEAWDLLTRDPHPAPSHPQFALAHLLETMEACRQDVSALSDDSTGGNRSGLARARLAQEALRPAQASEAWSSLADRISSQQLDLAYNGDGRGLLTLVEALDEREEALTIAVSLRETLESPGRTAALITPDRGLAERVMIELRRWNIQADDSAGRSLFRMPAGQLAADCLHLVTSDIAPRELLALMRHPLLRMGLPRSQLRLAAATLDIGVFRGMIVKAGLAGLHEALGQAPSRAIQHHAPRPRRLLLASHFEQAGDALKRIDNIFRPLADLMHAPAPSLRQISQAHRAAVMELLVPPETAPDGTQAEVMHSGDDIAALMQIFDALDNAGDSAELLESSADYTAIFRELCQGAVVPNRSRSHPRIKIWGLLEARLLQADRLVLGGLVEGVWPPATRTDAFLNRPMRQQVGLSSPERRIGQTAHDFVEAIAAHDVILTRARKSAGAETIPSRFWQRLKAVSPDERWAEARARGEKLTLLASQLSQPAKMEPRPRPRPLPPARLQPSGLSVTEIETLYRDPYAIYAKHILKLDPIEDIVEAPTAADRGTLFHAIVEQFTATYPHQLPDDAYGRLLLIGRRLFDEAGDAPEVRGFWWPRFIGIAEKFIRWESRRRGDLVHIATEVSAGLAFDLPATGPFRLRAKADRIETTQLGALRIIDFKTGKVPSAQQIGKGFAPQLTLQEALAVRGAFATIGARPVERSTYVSLSHEGDDLKESPSVKEAPSSDVSEQHLARLLAQLALYRAGKLPFLPHRAIEKVNFKRPYDQLARVKEWSGSSGEEMDDNTGEDNA